MTTDSANTGMISKHTYGIENQIDGTFEAAIAPEYLFSGDTNWVRNNASAHAGTWSIRSGYILNNYSSSVQITAKGPASISFWWRASCETNADWAYFYSDGVLQASNTGNTAVYKQVTYTMPAGNHVLMWTYAKNGAATAGNDCIYLDDITGLTNAAALSLARSCNPGTAQRVGYWIGRYDLNTNKYNVNAYDPFGVEIIRTYAWLDLLVHSDASGDLSRHAAVSMWLVDDANNIPKIQTETGVDADFWQTFNNSIEFCNEVGVWGTGDYRRYIAYFENALIPFALNNAIRPDGTTTNLSNIINFNFNADSAVDSGYGYGNGVPHASNLGFRMVHTGTSVDFFVNPNPYGQYTLPNEWMYIGSRPVSWSNNIQFMFGHAQKTADYRYGGGYTTTGNGPARADANFDDVLVRSVADVSAITFSPSNVGVSGSYVPVTLIISNYILPGMTNSGVNYIRIQKPDSYIGWNTDFTNTNYFMITTRYDGTTHQLTNGWYSSSRFPANGEASIMTNFQTNAAMSNEIRIVLGDQITNTGFATNGVIEIRMLLQITNEGFTGKPFTVYINAEQFDLMSPGQKGKYATTGWKKCSGSGLLSAKTDPPEGQASISPSTVSYISGTSNEVTFTYYLQFTNGGFHSNITHAAIVIPFAFTNCIITNFSSIYITNSAKMTVSKILNVTNAEGSSNIILLDYSDLNITVGGLDVVTFKVKGSPLAGSNYQWACYADNGVIRPQSPLFSTNTYFPSQLVGVSTNKVTYPYDFNVVLGGNSAPQSIGVSNIVPMGWFDITADGESPTESLSNCDVIFSGKKADVYGQLLVYRSTNAQRQTFSSNNYTLVASNWITDPTMNTVVPFADETNQSTDPVYPTRYWLALYITNTAAAVFTNTVSIKITNIKAGGPGGGLVNNLPNLTNALSNAIARVDSHIIFANVENVITSNVRQGDFNRCAFKFTLSNADPDATNYLSQMTVTNAGTAVKSDIGFLKIFIDTNNGTNVAFSTVSNKVVMAVDMDVQNNFNLSTANPIMLTGTNAVVFWGAYDVDMNATNTHTIQLRIMSNSNIIFSDQYNDGSDPRPAVSPFPGYSFPMATNAYVSAIIPYDSQTNDFYLQSVKYEMLPAAFTSNQYVPVAGIVTYMDTESTNTQVFKGMDVKLGSLTASNNINGWAYIYKETNGDGVFTVGDELVGSNAVTDGQPFSINCDYSNIVWSRAPVPDTLYLVFKLTNDITSAKSNSVNFQITNLRCWGPQSNYGNLILLTNKSAEARVDSGNVVVSQIITNINNFNPKQGDIDQPYLKIQLAGDDKDGINYLSYVDVMTNGLSTIIDSDVSTVALYFNTNNDGQIAHAVQLSVKTLSAGYARLSLSPALALTNTNQYTLFVGCNIKSGDTNSVGKKFGLLITNAAFGFVPGSTYNFLQSSFVSGTTNGPSTQTNMTIVDYRSQPYDFYLSGFNYATTPQAFSSNQFVPAGVMTVFRDYENLTTEIFNGIDVRLGSTHSSNNITGLAYLYRNTTNFTSSNYIGMTNVVSGASFSIDCAISNISTEALTPDTLYLAFVLTNDIELAKSNTVFFQITNLRCAGPDGGVFTNQALLATNSIEARADSGKVVTNFITNIMANYLPSQGSFNVAALALSLRGDDADATNALTHIDVSTNGLSTISPAHLASVKLYHDMNSNGVYDSGVDSIASVGTLNASNAVRLSFPSPFELAGTNNYYFMVGYDVSSDDTNAIGKRVGLTITNGSIGITNTLNDGFTHYAFAAPAAGPASETNGVISSLTSRPWDYKVLGAANVAPASITISNVYAMSYIDIVADGQNSLTEHLTNIVYYYSGLNTDVKGQLYLYRDTNDSTALSTSADKLITNFAVGPLAAGTNQIAFDDAYQSLDLLAPTRYWIALMITNTNANVFTNSIGIRLVDINGDGPNGNVISNRESCTNDGATVSRVDDFKVSITAENYMTNAQKQGTYESLVMRLQFDGADKDAVYYITNMTVTNNGTASNSDVSLVQVYLDNGDKTNFSGSDIVVGAGSVSNNRGVSIVFNPALAITGTNTVLWVAANVGFSATLNNTLAFQIKNTGDIHFGDQYADNYSQLPAVTVTAPLPAVVPTNLIIPYVSQPYDYILTGVDYSSMPQSFTTNQKLQAAVLTVAMDNDQPTNQRFIGIDGTVSNTNTGAASANVYGIAYLYLDTNGSGVFSNNQLIGSNAVNAGAGFSITFTNTNITINQSDPSKLYLVFMVTNSLSQNSNNTVRFQVTNLRCEGPNGGVFNNLSILTNSASRVSRIDTGRVLVSYISNELIPPSPSRSSFDNKYLKISVKGDDPDATNYLSSLRVLTNSATSSPFNFIPKVAVYDNANNMLGSIDFTAGDVTINFPSPVVLAGTNETILYVGYNVSSSLSAISKVLGIRTVAGSFVFSDSIVDNFPQTSFAVNDAGPADVSNVTVKDLSQNNWDIQVVNAGNVAPVSIGGTNLYAMGYFDVICDPQESAVIQGLSNVGVVIEGNASNIAGELRLYRDNDASLTNLSFSADTFLTNAFYAGTNGTNFFTFTTNNLSQTTSTPTRFWVALRVSNTNVVDVYSNTLRTKVVYIHGYGPDDYTNTHLLDEFVLTNVATNTARFDSYNVWAAMTATNNNQVLQSSFGNYYGAVSIMSADPDAVNYLHSMTLSNIGDALSSDLGQMRIFKDTGDGVFSSGVDELIMAGTYDGSGAYRLTAATPVMMGRRTNIFFVTYDVPFAAQLNRSIAFQIKDAASFVFTNGINDGINRTAQLTNTGPYPSVCETNQVAALASLPFDYDVLNVNYTMLPKAFTTNLLVPVGSFSMYRDITTSGYSMTQRVTNIQVALSSSGSKSNITGIAYVYKETNGDGVFSTNDMLLGSADVLNGGNFWVPCDSNDVITPNIYVPDTLYLVFMMTNDIEPAKLDSLRFQITNFDYYVEGGGKDTIPATNIYHFTNVSAEARIDSQKVVVAVIDNDMVSYFPSQNSADNPYLVIRLRGDDLNATNYLSYIDVSANGQSTVASGMIPYMALYTNKINALQLGTPATPSRAFNGTSVRLDFPVPLALVGTNVNTFYVGYNVDSASNVIDNRLGLTITNGAIGLSPVVSNASFVLKSFLTGVMSGPAPATNVKIQKLGAQYWDVKAVFSRNKTPATALSNVEIPIMYFDAYRENQSLAEPEYIAGLVLSNVYTNAAFYGYFNIYTNTKNDDTFTSGVCISSNNFISNMNSAVAISFSNSGSYDWDNPDRYFITYTPLSFASTATNMFRVTSLLSGGPNAGTTADQYWLTNLTMTPIALDNAAVTVSVSNLLATEALQGSNGIAAMRVMIAAADDDASYSLNSLSFSIEEIDGATNSIGNAALYSDTGTKVGEFDGGDTPVDGATGFFIGGKMKLTFNNTISITSNTRVFYLVVQIGGDAKANSRFRISMPRADQAGFTGINVAGTSYPVVLNNYSPDTTGYCTVLPSLEVKAEDKIAAANTFINIAKGEKASVYVVNNGDAALYRAYVYDAMGYKITELAFSANRADWGGEKAGGEKVRAGLYVIIVRGPNNFQKYFKILVTK
ncbi:MAG: hypothetical protein HZC28_15220 [Spirochaetes bacterium]|nr:hypothetical protein [Spirochaetota bacterium]